MKIDIKKVQERKEKKFQDQLAFMCILSTKMVLEKNHISRERATKITNEMIQQMSELSHYLTTNTCVFKGKEQYDYEYNREQLKRLSAEYGVKFDETIFDM